MEISCWKKTKYLEEKVTSIEGYVASFWSINRLIERKIENFTFFVSSSQSLHAQTSQSEWIVNSSCTYHMDKDASLFCSLSEAT